MCGSGCLMIRGERLCDFQSATKARQMGNQSMSHSLESKEAMDVIQTEDNALSCAKSSSANDIQILYYEECLWRV